MNTIKKWVSTTASKAGYDLLPKWKFERQPLVRHLKQIFEKQKIDCVLDVGANLGQYRDLLRDDVGFRGLILSFEPVEKYVNILKQRSIVDDGWKIFGFALGSSEQNMEINVTASPGLNSFLPPRKDAVDGFWDGQTSKEETVKVRTLDSVYPELCKVLAIASPYLKLDTQGFDLEVMKGGLLSLPLMKAMRTEASVMPIYDGMPTDAETRRFSEAQGFQVTGFFPVTNDEHMRLIEYDCVLVNSRYCLS